MENIENVKSLVKYEEVSHDFPTVKKFDIPLIAVDRNKIRIKSFLVCIMFDNSSVKSEQINDRISTKNCIFVQNLPNFDVCLY